LRKDCRIILANPKYSPIGGTVMAEVLESTLEAHFTLSELSKKTGLSIALLRTGAGRSSRRVTHCAPVASTQAGLCQHRVPVSVFGMASGARRFPASSAEEVRPPDMPRTSEEPPAGDRRPNKTPRIERHPIITLIVSLAPVAGKNGRPFGRPVAVCGFVTRRRR